MSMCHITATNWNGRQISETFKSDATDIAILAPRAHKELRRKGWTTYRLDSLNGTAVPYALQYA